MFPIRLVPRGNNFDALLRGHDAGAQLRLRLTRKAIPHSKGKSLILKEGFLTKLPEPVN